MHRALGGSATSRAGTRLAPHLALLMIVVAGLLLLVPHDRPWAGDDGAYHHAVRLVRDEGRWYEERPELDLVDHPARYPLALSDIDEAGRAYPYVKHPAWVVVLVATTRAFGDVWGLALPGVAAMVGSAVLAWHLSRRLTGGAPALAFWLVALGPLTITALGLWAHAVAAALGGLAAVVLCRLARRPSPPDALLLGVIGAAMVLVRTEGVFFCVALAVALVVTRAREADRRWLDPLLVAAIPAMALVGERAWIGSLTQGALTTSGPVEGPVPWLDGRLSGAWRSFGMYLGDDRALELGLCLVTGPGVLALMAVARGDRFRRPLAVVVVATALVAVPVSRGEIGLLSGIVPAWPAMVAGLVAGARLLWTRVEERALLVVVAVFAALIATTQYANGGGLEWGGRFLAPVAVPLAVLAASGLASASRGRDLAAATVERLPRRTLGAVALSGGALLAAGVLALAGPREQNGDVLDQVRSTSPDVAVANQGAFLPRYDLSGASPVWVRADRSGMDDAVERAFDGGATRVAVVGDRDVVAPGTTRTVVSPSVVLLTRAP